MSHLVGHSSGTVTKVAKADAGGVHRLDDIVTEEVSMVDRAANQRKFLVIKRSKDMGTEVTSNGKGGFTAAGGKTPVAKASLEVPPGFKEMVAPILDKAVEKLGALSKDLGGSKVADVDDDGNVPGIPAEFSQTLTTCIALLDKANTLFPVAAPESEAPADGEAPPEDMAAPSEMQMRAAVDAVGKIFGNTKLTKEAVAKVGAKMSKDRMQRFQQALQVLSSLVDELGTQPAPAAAPGLAGEAAKTAKAATDDIATLTAQVKELADLGLQQVATIKAQASELASLKKSRNGGNGSTVESVTPVEKGAGSDENVSWPFDLNNPVTRDTVGKGESFFPED